MKARTALLRIEGDLREQGAATSGVFRVSSGPLSVGIELQNADTKVILSGTPVEPRLVLPDKDASSVL